MVITYLGNDVYRMQFGETTLTFGEELKVKNSTNSFTITGPGEYEVGGVFIKGLLSEGKDKINTIYTASLENMNITFLGGLTNTTLSADAMEELESVDILFVPLDTLEANKAHKFAVSLEPHIVIPMRFNDTTLKAFLKESGAQNKTENKLTLKRKDLDGKKVEVIVLESNKE